MRLIKKIGNHLLLALFLSLSATLLIFIYSLSLVGFLSQTAAAVIVNFIEIIQYAPKILLTKIQRAARLIRKEIKNTP